MHLFQMRSFSRAEDIDDDDDNDNSDQSDWSAYRSFDQKDIFINPLVNSNHRVTMSWQDLSIPHLWHTQKFHFREYEVTFLLQIIHIKKNSFVMCKWPLVLRSSILVSIDTFSFASLNEKKINKMRNMFSFFREQIYSHSQVTFPNEILSLRAFSSRYFPQRMSTKN
jgi:hypothetical protein